MTHRRNERLSDNEAQSGGQTTSQIAHISLAKALHAFGANVVDHVQHLRVFSGKNTSDLPETCSQLSQGKVSCNCHVQIPQFPDEGIVFSFMLDLCRPLLDTCWRVNKTSSNKGSIQPTFLDVLYHLCDR